MRLLFLTNFYPPAGRGGYEEWCAEVAARLRGAGHEVWVLTSHHGVPAQTQPEPEWIIRQLYLEMELSSLRNALDFFTRRHARETANLRLLQALVAQHQPDAIVIWGMWNLGRSLPALAEKLRPAHTVYYMGDYWPTLPNQFVNYWQATPRNSLTSLPKRLLAPLARRQLAREPRPTLRLEHVLFPTQFMQQEFARLGMQPRHARVLYGAVDLSRYPYDGADRRGAEQERARQVPAMPPLQLLYVGRLSHEKGVHMAIEALGKLCQLQPDAPPQLTIVGQGESVYTAYLHELARKLHVAHLVTFRGAQPKEALPSLYAQADLFLFTSLWAEPFGRVLVEAMASGAVVVGAATGGASEIMQNGENALTFSPGDVCGLTEQILRLQGDPSLRIQLRESARQHVVEKFGLAQMADGIAAYLAEMLKQPRL